jgi:hypothetical protein
VSSKVPNSEHRRQSSQLSRLGAPSQPRSGKLFHMETPMENEKKSSQLFYLIIALIVLGFIANMR